MCAIESGGPLPGPVIEQMKKQFALKNRTTGQYLDSFGLRVFAEYSDGPG